MTRILAKIFGFIITPKQLRLMIKHFFSFITIFFSVIINYFPFNYIYNFVITNFNILQKIYFNSYFYKFINKYILTKYKKKVLNDLKDMMSNSSLYSKHKKTQEEKIFIKRQKHVWFIPFSSIWPFFVSINLFNFILIFLFILYFSYSYIIIFFLYINLLNLLFSLGGWFRDLIRESVDQGNFTLKVQKNIKYGFLLFLISEIMFFVSFFWAFFHFSLSPSIHGGVIWPNEGVINLLSNYPFDLDFYNIFFFNDCEIVATHNVIKSDYNYSKFYKYDMNLKTINASVDKTYLKMLLPSTPHSENKNLNKATWMIFDNEFEKIINKKLLNYNDLLKLHYLKFYTKTSFFYVYVKTKNFLLPFYFNVMTKTGIGIMFNNVDIRQTFYWCKGLPYHWVVQLDRANPCNHLLRVFYALELYLEEPEDNEKKKPKINYFIHLIKRHLILTNRLFVLNIYSPGALVNPWGLPALNTIFLLTSGAAITVSHKLLRLSYFFYSKLALLLTILLSFLFMYCQYYEYCNSTLSISDGAYSSVFFVSTGFHGIHVIIGTLMLIVSYGRFLLKHFSPKNHLYFKLSIWYWHFVDGVWVALYLFIYLWSTMFFFKSGQLWVYSDSSVLLLSKDSLKLFINVFINDFNSKKLSSINWDNYNFNYIKKDYLHFNLLMDIFYNYFIFNCYYFSLLYFKLKTNFSYMYLIFCTLVFYVIINIIFNVYLIHKEKIDSRLKVISINPITTYSPFVISFLKKRNFTIDEITVITTLLSIFWGFIFFSILVCYIFLFIKFSIFLFVTSSIIPIAWNFFSYYLFCFYYFIKISIYVKG